MLTEPKTLYRVRYSPDVTNAPTKPWVIDTGDGTQAARFTSVQCQILGSIPVALRSHCCVVKPMMVKGESLLSRIIGDDDVAIITMARMHQQAPAKTAKPGQPPPRPGVKQMPPKTVQRA